MTDKLIRELIVDVKQKGATKTAKSIQSVATGLEDAAAAAELTVEQLNKIPNSLGIIEKAANRASASIQKIGPNKGMTQMQKTLDSIEEYMDLLASSVIHMTESMNRGFKQSSASAEKMGNEIAAAVEKSEDQLIGLNGTLKKNSQGFDGMGNAAGKASRALGNTSGSARGATRDFSAMAKIGGSLPIMYAAIASNVFVLASAFDQLKTGDQLNRLMQFGEIIGAQTGTPVQNLAAGLQQATGYAISFEEAMKQASVASAYGFSTKQLEEFGLVARRAAAVLGVDMTDALNRVIKGVSKQEIELLDELGVTIRLNDAYAAYVKQLNAANTGIQYNMNSLTSYQKQQAYANAVVAESTRRFGNLDSVLRATPWEQFAANADSALRKLQQSAATYLQPVIASLNAFMTQTRAAAQATEAISQAASNAQIDPKNTDAVIAGLVNSKQGLEDANKTYEEALKKRNELRAEYDKRLVNAPWALKAAVNAGNEGLPTMVSDPANKAWVNQTVDIGNQIKMMNREVEDSQSNINAWKNTWAAATDTLKKASPELQKSLKVFDTGGVPGAMGGIQVDPNVLAGVSQISKEFKNLQTTSKDTATSIKAIGTDTNSAKLSAGALAESIKTVEAYSKSTGQSADTLVKKLNLGFESLDDMKKTQQAIDKYNKASITDKSMELAIEQARNKALAAGKDNNVADAEANKVKTGYLERQIAATKALLENQKDNQSLVKELNELETERLQTINATYKGATKIKDVSDKIVGIEEQIKLLSDSSLNSQQYTIATMQLQLKIEQDRQKILAGNAQKQKDYMQSKLEEARLQRQIREEMYSQENEALARQRDQTTALREAGMELGTQEQILANIRDKEKEIADLRKAAKDNNVAADTQTISQLNNQIAVLKKQADTAKITQDRGYQNSTTGLLGGTYGSTQGMSPEQKTAQEFQNSQDGYAQAISNLQAINSEATNAGQSIGNLVNAMMQYSSGSLDFSSVAAAGMQTIGQFISMGANQHISAIDAAIAAEQKRDGQSEESKNKIKKLEAEKVKIQQQSAKQQILISTATAIMQAATSVPYPYSIPLMIAAAAAGAMSYAQASNPTSASMSGLDSGSNTVASLSLGERDKKVDISQQANSGELSYMRGDKGSGNANTFIPRAEGGNMVPGVSYAVGENGIEVVTPQVPSTVTPADHIGSSNGGGSAPIIHLNVAAMDAKSFVSFAKENSGAFHAAVESALNEQGTTLKRLNK